MKLITTKRTTLDMYGALVKSVAMYDLLHAHARGETDLSEDQLANVVTGIAREARRVLSRVRGGRPTTRPPRGWARRAIHWPQTVRLTMVH